MSNLAFERLQHGWKLHQAGDLAEAEAVYRQVLALDPREARASYMLGRLAFQQGRHDEALRYLNEAVRGEPREPLYRAGLAESLQSLGRLKEAGEAYRAALALDPHYTEVHVNLGNTLLAQGQLEEAAACYRRAIQCKGALPEAHNCLGAALQKQGRLDEAVASFRQALALRPHHAQAHYNLGVALRQVGQFGAAVDCFQRAIELDPSNASAWEYLAESQGELDQIEASIESWRRSIALTPQRAEAHLGLGQALQRARRWQEAAEEFRAALALRPDFARAQLDLGLLHEELGELAEAEADFRAALRLQPRFALPHARLANLLGGNLPDADLAALEQRLADEYLPTEDRPRLLFGLAHVLDARGDYDRAASISREANALARRQSVGRHAYSAESHQRFVDMLVQSFDRDFIARVASFGSASRRPVFVFGLPRSGTTLVEQILASHSRAFGAGELPLARRSFDSIPALIGSQDSPGKCLGRLDRQAIDVLAERHLEALRSMDGGGAERVVDKMPENYLFLGILSAMFPHATFIHCRRDSRDVALSCWLTDFRNIHWSNDPLHIGARFAQYQRIMRHWRRVLNVPIVEVRYEDAVANLEPVARRLVEACGLAWEPACLEFHRTRRPVSTSSVVQVRQPIHGRSVGRWKNYRGRLDDLFEALPPPSDGD